MSCRRPTSGGSSRLPSEPGAPSSRSSSPTDATAGSTSSRSTAGRWLDSSRARSAARTRPAEAADRAAAVPALRIQQPEEDVHRGRRRARRPPVAGAARRPEPADARVRRPTPTSRPRRPRDGGPIRRRLGRDLDEAGGPDVRRHAARSTGAPRPDPARRPALGQLQEPPALGVHRLPRPGPPRGARDGRAVGGPPRRRGGRDRPGHAATRRPPTRRSRSCSTSARRPPT